MKDYINAFIILIGTALVFYGFFDIAIKPTEGAILYWVLVIVEKEKK